MRKYLFLLTLNCFFIGHSQQTTPNLNANSKVSLIILGNVQDAGAPQIGCKKACCKELFKNPDSQRKVTSLGVVDWENKKTYIFEASPDFSIQTKVLKEFSKKEDEFPNGIFLTHAHIGHYSGLMFLGKEAANAKNIPTYVMPKFSSFLKENGPWSQLVSTKNITLKTLQNKDTLKLTDNLKIIPFTVPHRDEYSETVGYTIIGDKKSALFIPDIDKWEKWEESIIEKVKQVDYAFLDATFFDAEEINNRDISEIPHPFVVETMTLFSSLPISEKKKIHFIHFNHTNPLLNSASKQTKQTLKNGFNITRYKDTFQL